MSTNKTENYHLHAWEPGDNFLLSEINENFAALDASARMIIGTYQGDDAAERFIPLPVTPKAVLVVSSIGVMGVSGSAYGGLALAENPAKSRPSGTRTTYDVVVIEENGFRVYENRTSHIYANETSETYHYIALW